MTIRPIKQAELEYLCKLEESLFSLEEGRFSPSIFRYHYKLTNRIFVAIDDEQIAGYVLVIMYAKTARIYSLAVGLSYQGRGYGKKLCQYAIDLAIKMKKKSISLEVRSGNKKAIELYSSLDFVLEKLLPSYYGNEDGVKMRKTIVY